MSTGKLGDNGIQSCGINPQRNQGIIQRPRTWPVVDTTDPEWWRKGKLERVEKGVVERFGVRFRVSCVGPGQTCRIGSETVPVHYS